MALPRWSQILSGLLLGAVAALCLFATIGAFSVLPEDKLVIGGAISVVMLLGSWWVLVKAIRLVIGRSSRGGLMGPTALTVTAWFFLLIPVAGVVLALTAGDGRRFNVGAVLLGIAQSVIYVGLFFTLRRMARERRDNNWLDVRPLTSHEQMAGKRWDDSYKAGPAPWDVGHPQQAVLRLAASDAFVAPVLDAGCGSGENTLHLASLGLEVVGVDVAETALTLAAQKAGNQRAQQVTFVVADAFQLGRLRRTFNSVLDCGLFHTFNRDERSRYAKSLASVVNDGGVLHLLCFADQGENQGPHPISHADLHAAFNAASGWSVVTITPERIETRFHDHGAPAWLAAIHRHVRTKQHEDTKRTKLKT